MTWFSCSELREQIRRLAPEVTDANYEILTSEMLEEGLLVCEQVDGVDGYRLGSDGVHVLRIGNA